MVKLPEKNYVVHIARFLKCVWPLFDIMHKKVKDRDDMIASVIYISILYKLPICNLLSCCLIIIEKSTPTNLFLNFFFVAPLLYLMKTTKVIPKFWGLCLRNKNKTLVHFYLEDNSYEIETERDKTLMVEWCSIQLTQEGENIQKKIRKRKAVPNIKPNFAHLFRDRL